MTQANPREAVAVFMDERSLQKATDELLISGFDHADISVLSNHDDVKKSIGHDYANVREIEDDENVSHMAMVDTDSLTEAETALVAVPGFVGAMAMAGPTIAYGGSTMSIAGSAIIGGAAGALIGYFFAMQIARRHKQTIQDQIERGGIVLWVHTADEAHERTACDILQRQGAKDVHVHDSRRAGHKMKFRPLLDRLAGIPVEPDKAPAK